MNRKFFDNYMHNEPKSDQEKILFIIDNENIALNILSVGYSSIVLKDNDEYYYSADELIKTLNALDGKGSNMTDYVYVAACSTKRVNDELENCFKELYLKYWSGWKLFQQKEYFGLYANKDELKKILDDFRLRFERVLSDQPQLAQFHKYNKNGEPKDVYDMKIVDYLLEHLHFFVIHETPYIYTDGVYNEDPGGYTLRGKIRNLMYVEVIKAPTINRVYELLISFPHLHIKMNDINKQPRHWINFKNGYYDVLEDKLISHDPKYRTVNQIPFEFYPEKKDDILNSGVKIKDYLALSLPDEQEQDTFWEYFGYCMTSDTRMQKFLMIKGNGGTGKSVMISLIQHVIGEDNYSCVTLQSLKDKFYPATLYGKLLNACADIPSEALTYTDEIKKIVGEDTIMYERKRKDPLFFNSYTRLLFSANELPKNHDDKSDAYYRRLLILELNHVVSENEKDPKLKEKLATEADYAIHMAVIGLRRLYTNKKFTESSNSRKCVQDLQHASDSIMAFLHDKMMKKEKSKVLRSEVYRAYEEYCNENDRKPIGKSKFQQYMEEKGHIVKRFSDGAYYYTNINWCETDFEPVDDTIKIPFTDEPYEQMEIPMNHIG